MAYMTIEAKHGLTKIMMMGISNFTIFRIKTSEGSTLKTLKNCAKIGKKIYSLIDLSKSRNEIRLHRKQSQRNLYFFPCFYIYISFFTFALPWT